MIRNALLAISAAVLLGGGLYYYGGHTTPTTQPALVSFSPEALLGLESAFNEAKGEVRMVVLLSPT